MKLHALITQYIVYRKSFGERFQTNERILKSFCNIVGTEIEVTNIGVEQVNAFLYSKGQITSSWHVKHNALLGFYRYVLSRGYATTSPLPTVKPKRPQPFVPYIYTQEELRRLLAAVFTYQKNRGRLEPYMVHTLLLLLYGVGLRLSKAIGLTLSDVDLAQKLLTIRNTKFFKTRLVPIGVQLNETLMQYVAWRKQQGYSQSSDAPFFVGRNGKLVNIYTIEGAFQCIRKQAGIERTDKATYQPRLHDLRHTFAVDRLTSWYQQGKDVQKLLPHLSVYLGHKYLAATSVYLTMTSELLHQASERFEHYVLKGEYL